MIKKCVICGKEFKARGNKICCSKECSIENHRLRMRLNKRVEIKKECKFCRKAFMGTKNTSFCSKECKSKHMTTNRKTYSVSCVVCNKEFLSKRIDSKYCSKECQTKWEKYNPRHTLKCKQCGEVFKSNFYKQQFCSPKCASEFQALYPIKTCEHCGKEFRMDIRHAGRFCSRDCFLNHIGAEPWERKMMIRDITHIRRAKALNIRYEKINVEDVFERDNWTCKICGEPVDKYLGYPNPMSASLDHIIPLSKGGTHTRDNVQLAHLKCNLKKGDELQGDS